MFKNVASGYNIYLALHGNLKFEKYNTNNYYLQSQSSLSIFAKNYLCKCEDTYFILQNKYLGIYEYSFGAKILGDDFAPFKNLVIEKKMSL